MDLYLMRHGSAEARHSAGARSDSRRPLTAGGARKVWRIARSLKAMDIHCDLILSSPLLRSRRTAEIVAAELGGAGDPELTTLLAPGESLAQLVDDLRSRHAGCESILLVGHEPSLSMLASVLISGTERAGIMMKKGGVCKLHVERIRYGQCAVMEWLLAPAHLKRLH